MYMHNGCNEDLLKGRCVVSNTYLQISVQKTKRKNSQEMTVERNYEAKLSINHSKMLLLGHAPRIGGKSIWKKRMSQSLFTQQEGHQVVADDSKIA